MPRLAGLLTRVALLIPLLAGARVDCGTTDTGALPVGAAPAAAEPDCHHGRGQQHSSRPDAPTRHHGGGPQGGHCPVYHSCAVDFSLTARLIPTGVPVLPSLPAEAAFSAFTSRSQLPEVPPPKS